MNLTRTARTSAYAILMLAPPTPAATIIHRPPPTIETARTPSAGIQPQAIVGPDGVIHLLYYNGDPKEGDLFYAKRAPADADWSTPRRVNSQAKSAIAMGNDRGGQIALGRDGIIHIAWNGSAAATPQGPDKSSPMLYTRLLPGQDAFEPQRNVMLASTQLDGGGSIAADPKGNVYIVWHGTPLDGPDKKETGRRVFVAASTDDGRTFTREAARSDPAAGACGCCGLKAAALPDGDLLILYRSAGQSIHRDTHLMRSTDLGKTFTDRAIDDWEINACPMTTAAITPSPTGAVIAWETKEDIRWTLSRDGAPDAPIHTVGKKNDPRKYPAVAVDKSGQILIAWAEGMHWSTPGRLRWSVFDSSGQPIETGGTTETVPAWSLVAAVAKPGGGFLILY